jgi:hypothetical protein
VVTGSNVLEGRTDYFSHKTHPTMPISKAVRISSSIPLFFDPVVYEGALYVDGGAMNNFPIDIFDDGNTPNSSTLGFSIGPETNTPSTKNPQDLSTEQYLVALVDMMLESVNGTHTKPDDLKRTVVVDPHNIKTTDFDLSEQQKHLLVASGTTATIQFLQERCYDIGDLLQTLSLPTLWNLTLLTIEAPNDLARSIEFCIISLGDLRFEIESKMMERKHTQEDPKISQIVVNFPMNIFSSSLNGMTELQMLCFDERWFSKQKRVGSCILDLKEAFETTKNVGDRTNCSAPLIDEKNKKEVGQVYFEVQLMHQDQIQTQE